MPKINVEKIHSLTGHKDCLYTITQGPKNTFFTSGGDGLVVQWDRNEPELGKLVAQVENSVYALDYVPDENKLYIGHNFQGVHLIELDTNKESKSIKFTDAYIFDMKLIGPFLYCLCGDGQLIVLNGQDLQVVDKRKISEKSLRSLAYQASRQELAIGTSDHQIYIVDQETLEVKHVLKGHTNSVFTVAYHPNLPLLLSTGRDAHVRIWDTKTYQEVDKIVAHMYAINHLTFDKEGTYFYTASMDKSIKIWDAATFQLLKVIDKARHAGHGTSVNKLLKLADTHELASVSDDRSISIWRFDVDNS